MNETTTAYRAINEDEISETARLNDMDILTLLASRGKLNFMLHEKTNWDYRPDNWAGDMLDRGERRAIVELTDEIIGFSKSKHLYASGMSIKPGCFIWAVATVSAKVKVKIIRALQDGDISDSS